MKPDDGPIHAADLVVGHAGIPVVSGLSFSLDPGHSTLIVGQNGTGKSTLLQTLFGLLPPLGGKLSVLGLQGAEITPARLVRAGARYLGQGNRSFDSLTVAQSRNLLANLYGFPARRVAAPPWDARTGSLSLGQRRIEALRLLEAGMPRCFLLDEPSSGLDVRHVDELRRWMSERRDGGASFIVVEQQFRGWLKLADRAIVLRAGEVSFFGPARSLLDESVLDKAFF